MARKPVVSRSVKYTSCRCLMIDLRRKQQYVLTQNIRGTWTKDEINKRGDKFFTTAKQKFITCSRVEYVTINYEMSIDDFTRAATIKNIIKGRSHANSPVKDTSSKPLNKTKGEN